MSEPRWRRYVRFWRRDPARDVDDELRFHFAERVAEFEAAGLLPSAAHDAARERFGDVGSVRRELIGIDKRVVRRVDVALAFDMLRQELRYALRRLRREPAFVAAVVTVLALAVGANGAVFSLLDPLFLRPARGVADPGSLQRVYDDLPGMHATVNGHRIWDRYSYPAVERIRDAVRGRAVVGIDFTLDSVGVTRGDAAITTGVTYASASLLPLLGVRIAHGRTFSKADDDVATPSPVAVISDRFAREVFGEVEDPLGQVLEVRGVQYRVIGVAAPGFDGISLSATGMWLPFSTMPQFNSRGGQPWYRRGDVYIPLVLRVLPGADRREIEARASVALERSFDSHSTEGVGASIRLGPLLTSRGPIDRSREEVIATRIALIAGLLLLIACANVANLLLARGVTRRREFAVRLALGVPRTRLALLVLIDSLIVALLAGGASLLVAGWAGSVLRTQLLPSVRWSDAAIGFRVLAFTFVVALATGLAAGTVPAFAAARGGLSDMISGSVANGVARRRRARASLLALQAALAIVLLAGAVLVGDSLHNVRSIDLGYDSDKLAVGTLYFRDGGQHAELATLLPQVARRIASSPGVAGAGVSYGGPMAEWSGTRLYRVDADSAHPIPGTPNFLGVEPGYFAVTGTRIIEGRPFVDSDRRGAEPVIVVGETMARQLWPGQRAIGQCLRPVTPSHPCYRVVGVARDAHQFNLVVPDAETEYYYPLDQLPMPNWRPNVIIARAGSAQSDAVATLIDRELRRAFPTALVGARSMTTALTPQLRPWIFGARLFGALAGLALIVAMIGVYGAVAFEVRHRMREIGVRMALGARAVDVFKLLVREGALIVAVGVLLGTAVALAGGRLIASMPYGTTPNNPFALAGSAFILLAAAFAACSIPVWRAGQIDPAIVLRDE